MSVEDDFLNGANQTTLIPQEFNVIISDEKLQDIVATPTLFNQVTLWNKEVRNYLPYDTSEADVGTKC